MAYYDNYLQGFIELIRVKKIMLDASLTLLIALSGKIYIIKAKPLAFIFSIIIIDPKQSIGRPKIPPIILRIF